MFPTPMCIHTHTYERPFTHVKDPVVHVGVWWIMETKITRMHLYPRRWNVAAQAAEELITVTYATPPMEERRKKERK